MTSSFLDALKQAATDAEKAEADYRRDFATRVKALEQERAFAYRRLNLMRAIAGVIANAESEELAIAHARAALQEKLSWRTDSDARTEVLTHFAPVAKAAFGSLAPPEAEAEEADVAKTLADFEAWYLDTRKTPFWVLFEQHVAESPVVDF